MQRFAIQIVLLVTLATSAGMARADFILSFSTDGGTTYVTEVSGVVGNELNVGLFLLQVSGATRLNDDGLITFGTRGTYADTHAEVIEVALNDTLFSDISRNTGVISSTEIAFVGEDPTFVGVRQPSILLGEFTLETKSVGETIISFGDFDSRSNASDFVLGDDDFSDIDGVLFSSSREATSDDRSRTYSLTVRTVPEASSLIFLLAGCSVLFLRLRRSTVPSHDD